jgi:hypothetical protein
VHLHISEAVRHDGRDAFNETNLPSVNEFVASDFNGINEIIHAYSILASFIQKHVEIELVVIVVVTIGIIARFIGEFHHLLVLFNHKVFELLVLFQQLNNEIVFE